MKVRRFLLIALLLCLVFPFIATADQLENAKTAIKNGDFSKAHELLLPLVEAENTEALALLDSLYSSGQVSGDEMSEGLSLIMNLARKGYKPARLSAFKSNLEIANQGDTSAMFNAGYMCLNDWGGEHDSNVCLKWLENAARLGHEKSSKYLSKIYTEGKYGITPDKEKATYWKDLGAAFAAGIDGKWEGSLDMKGGGQPTNITFDFKTDGDKLTGTYFGGFGRKTPISDGKFDGTNVSFEVKTSFMGMKSTTNYTGTFYGDSLTLTSTTKMTPPKSMSSKTLSSTAAPADTPPVTFTVKRAG